ncbi:MAG TPA: hypothetical protein VE988_00205 [Gemmataceae bacterium]|nr:hypothetical protein [Gemmataceae bacterium]
MNQAAFDHTEDDATNGHRAPALAGDGSAAIESHSSQEIARLKAECVSLRAEANELRKERDSYLQSLQAYVKRQIPPEPEVEWAGVGFGETSESILGVMDRIDQELEASKKP